MKRFCFVILIVISSMVSVSAKEIVDTIYYDTDWKGCSKTFATYYRVLNKPTKNNPRQHYKDFYITGELQGEGDYISIDPTEGNLSVFDGEIKTYYKSGNILRTCYWTNSRREGDSFEFHENGNVKNHMYYNNGVPDGEVSLYNENGELTSTIKYHNGINDPYCTLYNQYGSMGNYSLNSHEFVPEAVTSDHLKSKIINGTKFLYYDDKNGIYLSITVDAIKHYGKYYRVGVSIFNNTLESIIFDPTQIKAVGRWYKKNKAKKNKTDDSSVGYLQNQEEIKDIAPLVETAKDIKVWSFEDYTKKVRNRQQWDAALVGLGSAMSTWGAGHSSSYSTTTTYGFGQPYGGYAYTTHTTTHRYNPTAAAIARQNALNTAAAYSINLEEDTKAINENYLRLTTIDPQNEISGYFLLNKDKPIIIDLSILINGIAYKFHLTEIPK